MSYEAAIFDMDGLLIDSERTIQRAWVSAASEQGHVLDLRGYARVIGVNAADSDRILRSLFAQANFERAKTSVTTYLASEKVAELYPAKPGAVALLAELQTRGVPCAVASSSATAEVKRRLGAIGLLKFFGPVVGGDLVARGKPHPDLYELAARRLGRSVRHCLAFEDSNHGVMAARAAGIDVVLIPDLAEPTGATVGVALARFGSLVEAMGRIDEWFSRSTAR